MTPIIVAVGIGVLGLVVAFLWQRWPLRDVGRDVGLSVFVEDEMEDQPIDTIDEALAQTTDPDERDALLDVRLRAMGGAQ